MPACKDCEFFRNNDGIPSCESDKNYRKRKEGIEGMRICRACAIGMILKRKDSMRGDVLEVGCGHWKFLRVVIRRNAKWFGLEPRWGGKGTYQGTVGNIPFEDNRFDWVATFCSIEHWNRRRDTIEDGIKEIHRVLKVGGKILIHAPFNHHGSEMLYLGKVDEFKQIFRNLSWKNLTFEEWGRDHDPFPPFYDYRTQRNFAEVDKKYGNNPPSAWSMEVYAEKIA